MAELNKARNLNQWSNDISEVRTPDDVERLLQRAANIDDEYLREDVGEMLIMHAIALDIPFARRRAVSTPGRRAKELERLAEELER